MKNDAIEKLLHSHKNNDRQPISVYDWFIGPSRMTNYEAFSRANKYFMFELLTFFTSFSIGLWQTTSKKVKEKKQQPKNKTKRRTYSWPGKIDNGIKTDTENCLRILP